MAMKVIFPEMSQKWILGYILFDPTYSILKISCAYVVSPVHHACSTPYLTAEVECTVTPTLDSFVSFIVLPITTMTQIVTAVGPVGMKLALPPNYSQCPVFWIWVAVVWRVCHIKKHIVSYRTSTFRDPCKVLSSSSVPSNLTRIVIELLYSLGDCSKFR